MNVAESFISITTEEELDKPKKPCQLFKIENITVVRPRLLKVYYWEYLNIEGFNEKLLQDDEKFVHNFYLPTSQLNSKPLKIVYWIKNLSPQKLTLTLKRIQNCSCKPMETRVGFNQFRYLYHCPHRHLINITQDIISMNSEDLVAMSVVAYFYLLGEHVLSYEMRCSDSRVITLNFHVDIVTFDATKSVLTKELTPVCIKDFQRSVQPIWITNITMQSIPLQFKKKCGNSLRLINRNIIVPPLSTWPLIIDYRPKDFENNMQLNLSFNGVRYKIPLTCKAYVKEIPDKPEPPIYDYDCADFLYVIYPNKLVFNAELNEELYLMVAVHNYNQNCMDFKWQPYSIYGHFSITFEPCEFNLKPHHTHLCMVCLKTFDKSLCFPRVPAILEVHRILNKKANIARELLTDIESIDNPKWRQDTYVEHVYMQIDIKVNCPKEKPINLLTDGCRDPLKTNNLMLLVTPTNKPFEARELEPQTTIFEKLFWEYLSKTSHYRNTSKIPRNLTYEEVISGALSGKNKNQLDKAFEREKRRIFNIVCHVLADACRDLAKNYRFVPSGFLDPI